MVVAQSFMKQLKTLTKKEQGAVSRVVLELQADPTDARHSLHKVDGNGGWWSAYVNGDLRIILQRPGEGEVVVCWTDHHDKAYEWARAHTYTRHPVTGAMQLVEIPVVVEAPKPAAADVAKPSVPAPKPRPTPCAALGIAAADLLAWGVPEVWVEKVLAAPDEDALLAIGEHLPSAAMEVVLKIAVGEKPEAAEEGDDAAVDDGSRDWWVVTDDEDLKRALDANLDWETWCVYLHPSQKRIAERTYAGPYRVCGSAGTGKTVVALHHARHILRTDPAARVLVATFSSTLAEDLDRRCRPLMSPRELERCEATSVHAFAKDLYLRTPAAWTDAARRPYVMKDREWLAVAREVLEKAGGDAVAGGLGVAFVLSEMERVVEPRQIADEEAYVKAKRRGVTTRLSEARRRAVWQAVVAVRAAFGAAGRETPERMFGNLAAFYRAHAEAPRLFTHAVIDESQDLCEAELDFLAAYFGTAGGTLFFAGDVGQRIIRYPFPWKPFGIDLRGRSRVLKVNYRTTREIRGLADRLMEADAADADGVEENRRGTVSLLTGPKPEIRKFATPAEEGAAVTTYLNGLKRAKGLRAEEVAVFVRSEVQIQRAMAAVMASDYGKGREGAPLPRICTMFAAKGLEYRAAVVMACEADVLPDPGRLAEAGLVAAMSEIYDTERNLLYVACTRARDFLLVTCGGVPSELLLDLRS